ncbi:MAG: hypothetical protein ACKVKG_15855 [Alphaproteobacteria bacterium]|jgi:hypothetical protein
MKSMLTAVAVVLVVTAMSGTTAHAAPDKSCLIYVSMIGKQLKTRFRVSRTDRERIKALREEGQKQIENSSLCQPPLKLALRMMGVKAPVIQGSGAKRRAGPPPRRRRHRIGSERR